jgi:single-stranded-DNA-specific exonuclease
VRIHEWDYALREPLTAVYRTLRAAGGASGEACEQLLRGAGPQPRSASLAGRLVRVLTELALARLDRTGPSLQMAEHPQRTALERSAAFMAYQRRLEDGRKFLNSANMRRLAA